jgi:hypothetical protein
MDFSKTTGASVIAGPFQRRLRNARWVAGLFGLLRILLQGVGGALVGGVFLLSLKLFFSIPVTFVRGVWIFLVGSFLAFFIRALWRLRPLFQIPFVADKLGGQPRDLFLTAWELTEEECSDEFRRRAWAQADKAFPVRWVGRLVPPADVF